MCGRPCLISCSLSRFVWSPMSTAARNSVSVFTGESYTTLPAGNPKQRMSRRKYPILFPHASENSLFTIYLNLCNGVVDLYLLVENIGQNMDFFYGPTCSLYLTYFDGVNCLLEAGALCAELVLQGQPHHAPTEQGGIKKL